jgi:hypothetical protein
LQYALRGTGCTSRMSWIREVNQAGRGAEGGDPYEQG